MAELDNDKFKWNKRVSGTDLKISSPEILKKYKNPIVIMPLSPYSKEIKTQILETINRNTLFWEIA